MKTTLLLTILFLAIGDISASPAEDRFLESVSITDVLKFRDTSQAVQSGPTVSFPDGQVAYRYELVQAVEAFQARDTSLSKNDIKNLLTSEREHIRYAICLYLPSKYGIDPVKLGYRPLQDPNSASNLKATEAVVASPIFRSP